MGACVSFSNQGMRVGLAPGYPRRGFTTWDFLESLAPRGTGVVFGRGPRGERYWASVSAANCLVSDSYRDVVLGKAVQGANFTVVTSISLVTLITVWTLC